MNNFDPLKAIICGFEKSGTTLLNEILRRHPDMDSGFEGGFLLGNSPRDFPTIMPYYDYFKKLWKLTDQDMAYICDTDKWAEAYKRSRERSPVIHNKKTYVFDKTPIYMLHLTEVLEKVPGIPCVVIVRDPRSVMNSWAKWTGNDLNREQWITKNLKTYSERYLSYADGYTKAAKKFENRIVLIQFENLCIDPEANLTSMFNFLGLVFRPEYLNFSSKYNVYGNRVSKDYLFPYRDHLSITTCNEILKLTRKYSRWHYSINNK